jgi:hypothetical protein
MFHYHKRAEIFQSVLPFFTDVCWFRNSRRGPTALG